MEDKNRTLLRQIADRLELGEYPVRLETVYRQLQDSSAPACDLTLIEQLQEKYQLFAEFYDLVRQTAQQINDDPDLNIWVRTAAKFYREHEKQFADKLPVPVIGESAVRNFMMLHILMPTIPDGFESMQARGFSWDELEDMRTAYAAGIRNVQRLTGKPGVNRIYFSWLGLYCRGQIFETEGFWFQLRKFPASAVWLRNRETKQILPLLRGETFYRDGSIQLGSKNYEDPAGAFITVFEEDAENYYGHSCVETIVSRQRASYPKSRWECIGAPEMYCLGIHVPRGADISRETTLRTCKCGIKMAHLRFPEYGKLCCIVAISWLFNPKLKDILGESSRILQFQDCFITYPCKDTKATEVFDFAFRRKPEKWEELEESTSLQRKLKNLYVSGDCLHVYSGALFLENN